MNQERTRLYNQLEGQIGNTPLYLISNVQIPRKNVVFVKEENRNPGGSHYDRVFMKMFRYFEELEKIIPRHTPVVETTSGSAGVSFARLARLLGYECLVVCPESLPQGRLNAIRAEGAELRLTPGDKYVDGSAEELGNIFRIENKQRKAQGLIPYFGLNHTQGESANIASKAAEDIVREAVAQASDIGIKFDIIIAASGNGTTGLGFGRQAKQLGIPFVVWETLGSGLYFDGCYQMPDGSSAFQYKYGISPGLGKQSHQVIGTAYGPTPFPLPNLETLFQDRLIDTVRILSDQDTVQKVLAENSLNNFQRSNIERLQTWEAALILLRDVEGKPVGRSSAGNLAMVLDENWRIQNMKVLTFFYDDLSRY